MAINMWKLFPFISTLCLGATTHSLQSVCTEHSLASLMPRPSITQDLPPLVEPVVRLCSSSSSSSSYLSLTEDVARACRPLYPTSFVYGFCCDDSTWTTVDPSAFPDSVPLLVINYTSIHCLKPDSFREKVIQMLVIEGHELKDVDLGSVSDLSTLVMRDNDWDIYSANLSFFSTFEALDSLNVLNLENNNIVLKDVGLEPYNSSGDDRRFRHLEHLSLAYNPLRRLEAHVFDELRAAPLASLDLRHGELQSIHRHALRPLRLLNTLDLRANPSLLTLWPMPMALASSLYHSELHNLRDLSLADNELNLVPTALTWAMRGVSSLDLSGNEFNLLGLINVLLPSINTFAPSSQLKHLNLRSSAIEVINEQVFTSLALETLDLSRNRLGEVPKALTNMRTLIKLDLSHQCENDECPMGDSDEESFLIPKGVWRGLQSLSELNMDSLRLRVIERDAFDHLHNLEVLNLNNVVLESIEKQSFASLNNLRRLQLSSVNLLHDLNLGSFEGLEVSLSSLDLSFSFNAFRRSLSSEIVNDCDAQMEEMRSSVAPTLSPLVNLTHLQLSCVFNIECKDHCEIDIETLLNFPLPNLRTLDLSWNGIVSFHSLLLNMADLKSLDLAFNSIGQLTDGMLEVMGRLNHLDLSNNPFVCSENVAKFHALVMNRGDQLDVRGYDQGRGYECKMEDKDEDKDEVRSSKVSFRHYAQLHRESERAERQRQVWQSVLHVLLAMTLVGSVLMMVYLGYEHRFHLSYFWLTHVRAESGLGSSESGPGGSERCPKAKYDAFISFTDEEEQWVLNELMPSLESSNQRVCVHKRDFTVGLSISENIVECLDRSRVFLLVLTQDFHKSRWCMFETHLANTRMRAQRKQILVLVRHSIKHTQLNATLRSILTMYTYIKWPSTPTEANRKLFYNRLKICLIKTKVNSQQIQVANKVQDDDVENHTGSEINNSSNVSKVSELYSNCKRFLVNSLHNLRDVSARTFHLQ